jgi:hypothetical protein
MISRTNMLLCIKNLTKKKKKCNGTLSTKEWCGGHMKSLAILFGAETMNVGKELAETLVKYVFPFVCMGAIIWALAVGIRFGMAKDEQGRNIAKKRLMNAIASVIIIGICYSIMIAISTEIILKKPAGGTDKPPNQYLAGGRCPTCKGTGWVNDFGSAQYGETAGNGRMCLICDGTGEVDQP